MRGDLSQGLPALGASGNRIVRRDTGAVAHLRGVNRSGLEYAEPGEAGFLHSSGVTRAELDEIITRWGCNVIRVPFNQDWALRGRGRHSAEVYKLALDQIVYWAASLGAYTLLDLQWLDADTVFGQLDDGSENHIAPLPSEPTIELWATLAERYREEPAVLFDLYNEPHTPLADDFHTLYIIDEKGKVREGAAGSVGPAQWRPWARKLIDTIRLIHPLSLICVAGVDWAYDLRGMQLDLPNLIYSAHVYPNRPPQEWNERFGQVSGAYPVFIGEWGGGPADLDWGARFASYIKNRCCGWSAWSWVDRPLLVRGADARDYTPTLFGELVRSELRDGKPENATLNQPRDLARTC